MNTSFDIAYRNIWSKVQKEGGVIRNYDEADSRFT